MATYTSNQVAQTNSTTTMRAHVAFVEALLTAAGWVQTADTGQTASGAFPAATGTNTSAGYQVWRMNDALQATAPVFVRFDFGSGAAANTLGVWCYIGTGSNGSGTITGQLNGFLTPQQVTSASSLPSYGSGSTNRICAVHNYQTTTANCTIMWGIERSKDATGADTADGVIFNSMWGAAGTLQAHQYLPFTGTKRTYTAWITTTSGPAALGSLVDGANTGLLPVIPMGQLGPQEQGLNFLLYYSTDLVANNNTSVTVKGSAKTYKPLGTPQAWGNASVITASCFAIRYE